MAGVKDITELPVVTSTDGMNFIVNDNGSAKQIAASEVGAQANWDETDETSPAFIMNKPTVGGAVTYTTTNGCLYNGNWENTDSTQLTWSEVKSAFESGVIRLNWGIQVGTVVGYYVNTSNENIVTLYVTSGTNLSNLSTNYVSE